MTKRFIKTEKIFEEAQKCGVFPGGILSIGNSTEELYRNCIGYKSLYPEKDFVTEETLFDMASLTKIMSTTMVALRFIEEGLMTLGDTLELYFTNVPEDKKQITIHNLMTHTAGLSAVMPIYSTASSPEGAADSILKHPLEYVPGEKVVYSCLGYILLGKILEIIGSQDLAGLSSKYVFEPLNMKSTGYNPKSVNIASTEFLKDKNLYLKGVVHDENARYLGGISGNAGVFSNIKDMNTFAQMLSNEGGIKEKSFIGKNTFRMSIHNYTRELEEQRGLGFSLKTMKSINHPSGDLFSEGSFGHTGFTGTSLWVDKETGMYVILLTNRVHPTRDNIDIIRFRRLLHNCIITEYLS
ncbi:serine hydrolase domain-containing protein [Clostridium polynesiense]|uniref:serine hydrolase domain-containing protein n=1 Tax=Clostridium polynesiense TaxID=1325933 RepID=UPI00058ACE69|nr:serine hydrolase domain-containing protein [Clostridium polynesiense]